MSEQHRPWQKWRQRVSVLRILIRMFAGENDGGTGDEELPASSFANQTTANDESESPQPQHQQRQSTASLSHSHSGGGLYRPSFNIFGSRESNLNTLGQSGSRPPAIRSNSSSSSLHTLPSSTSTKEDRKERRISGVSLPSIVYLLPGHRCHHNYRAWGICVQSTRGSTALFAKPAIDSPIIIPTIEHLSRAHCSIP